MSLPKDWIKRLGLKRGDLVAIIERGDGALLVDPKYSEREHLRVAEIEMDEGFTREITAKYLYGYDIIRLKSKGPRINPYQREEVKKSLQQLVGVEIVEEDAREITLQCLLSPSAVPLRRTMKRTYLIAAKMQEEVITALKELDDKLAKNVINRDEEVNRLYFLIVRQLRTAIQDPRLAEKMGVTPIECLDYRAVVKSIEALADYAVKIAKQIPFLQKTPIPQTVLQKILELSQITQEIHSNAIEALLRKDVNLASKTIAKKPELEKALNAAYEEILNHAPLLATPLNTIVDMLDRIAECGIDIADLT
ncbi:MAG: PhoU domain-containing protein [Candidatus Freyarchaeota archaeon]|nr:PhoU domain-containing protein [Candidatus Sigynarchaeota archaeon]